MPSSLIGDAVIFKYREPSKKTAIITRHKTLKDELVLRLGRLWTWNVFLCYAKMEKVVLTPVWWTWKRGIRAFHCAELALYKVLHSPIQGVEGGLRRIDKRHTNANAKFEIWNAVQGCDCRVALCRHNRGSSGHHVLCCGCWCLCLWRVFADCLGLPLPSAGWAGIEGSLRDGRKLSSLLWLLNSAVIVHHTVKLRD